MTHLTAEAITEMRAWAKVDAATRFHARVREIEIDFKRTFVELGLICVEVEDRCLYENMEIRYESFNQWLRAAMPTQHSSAYAARNAIRVLKGVIPEKDLREIPRANLETLAKCSSDIARNPEYVQAAKELGQNDFIKEVNDNYPDQHLEERNRYHFSPTKDQRETIDAAISGVRVLMEDDGISREECLWHLARTFLEDNEEALKAKVRKHEQYTSEAIQ